MIALVTGSQNRIACVKPNKAGHLTALVGGIGGNIIISGECFRSFLGTYFMDGYSVVVWSPNS